MDPNLWGPGAWFFLHAITRTYPVRPSETKRTAAVRFFNSLKDLLPCSACAAHYGRLLQEHPVEPHVHSRTALARWFVDIHNRVNRDVGKKQISYDDFMSVQPPHYQDTTLLVVQLTTFIVAIGALYYFCQKR